jgi:hypothetical protein
MDESTKQKVYDTHRMWLKLEKAKDMKITEQTKIKDLIPEGMSLKDCESTEWSIHIDFKPKEKTFEDYEKDYYKDRLSKEAEGLLMLNVDAENLNIENRLGLLWYIVKDKYAKIKSKMSILGDVLYQIDVHNREAYGEITKVSNEALEIIDMLPPLFIESFKEE